MTDILCVCKKCGREFLTIPKFPAIDVFGPANVHYRPGDAVPVCGGEIELTELGRQIAGKDWPSAAPSTLSRDERNG